MIVALERSTREALSHWWRGWVLAPSAPAPNALVNHLSIRAVTESGKGFLNETHVLRFHFEK